MFASLTCARLQSFLRQGRIAMIAIAPTSTLSLPDPFNAFRSVASQPRAAASAVKEAFAATGGLSTVSLASAKPSDWVRRQKAAWLDELTANARRLSGLASGWDGPGSVPISRKVLFRASKLSRDALEGLEAASAPSLVPGGDGSIQIEWHEKHGELELVIHPSGESYIWGRIYSTGAEFEGEDEKALALFYRWAPWMASPQCDVADAPLPPSRAAVRIAA